MDIWDDSVNESSGDDASGLGASVLRRQREEENAARQEIFNAKLQEIFAAAFHDPTKAARSASLRAIVDNDEWFVPLKSDGSLDVTEVEAGKYRLAIEDEDAPSGQKAQKKRKKQGRGGPLLFCYAAAPDRPAVQLDGRALARALPPEVAGLLLHRPDKAPRELGRELFPELIALADAFDLEELLLSPGRDQIEKLKGATWFVEMKGKALHLDSIMDDGRLCHVYTHPDRVGYRSVEVIAMTGEQLFRLVAETDAADGVVVNRTSQLGRGENVLNGLALSPGFACRLLEGEDIRPGAHPLPTRSREEAELWLRLHEFPYENREWVEAPYAEETLARMMVPQASKWRAQETLGGQIALEGPTWSPVFTLPPVEVMENTPAWENEVGAGPSRILCAGLLAKELNADSPFNKDADHYWRVGRGLLAGRLLDEDDRARSRRRLVLARELKKLLPPGKDSLPRSALLTVEGAALLAECPHAGTRVWIEATIRQAERYTKRWVWRG